MDSATKAATISTVSDGFEVEIADALPKKHAALHFRRLPLQNLNRLAHLPLDFRPIQWRD